MNANISSKSAPDPQQPPAVTAQRVAEVTLVFWIMKICATTLGETAGDLLSMTMGIGYAASSLVLLSAFVLTLTAQLLSKRFHPLLYWSVILSTSTAGTTMSDYLDRTLGLGYFEGSLFLASLLVIVLVLWRLSVGTLSVSKIETRKAEAWYWLAILVSNTLGTALGDYLADDSGLGFLGGAALISGLIAVIAGLHFTGRFNRVWLFWLAFVLTRPLGATVGDLLTKPLAKGGLNLGTIGSSAVLFGVLLVLVITSGGGARTKQKSETS